MNRILSLTALSLAIIGAVFAVTSVQHASGLRAQSAKVSLQGGGTRKASNADSKDGGLTRSASCYNASGASIACPTRP